MGELIIQAWYENSPVLEYTGNPLIEAMPPILSEVDAADRLAVIPPMPNTERALPRELRLHCINRLSHLVQPLPIHLELEAAVSSVLRGGYVGRNPMESGTVRHLHALAARKTSITIFNSTASTFSLVGLSGMGKTTALDSVLRLYPQVIKHTRYNSRDFIHTQIVWLKLECPFDGSLSGLCRAFFQAVDSALGDDTYSRYYLSQMSIPRLIAGMEQVASTYFVGAIFIDELQHLKSAKSGGQENMLNFFVNLVNRIGVPVVFIGTNSMIGLFGKILRNARRASGLGLLDFKQPTIEGGEWDLLVNQMWKYQWVKEPVPLSEPLRALIYDLTQGVTDFLAKLMILGQKYAIQSGVETLNEEVFRHVSNTKMKLLQPAIAALRSGDFGRMGKFEDLLPTEVQLDEMMRDNVVEIGDRLAVLRRERSALDGHHGGTHPGSSGESGRETIGIGSLSQDTAQDMLPLSDERAVPLSAKLGHQTSSLALLKEADWILNEPFEFTPAYRAA